MTAIERFNETYLDGVVALCSALDWPSYAADPATTLRALSAPGSTTFVAVDDGRVVGLAQIQGDGEVQAHLSLLGVLASYRREGLASSLLRTAAHSAGGKWLDLVAEEGSEPFYRSLLHQERAGFRVYPQGSS